MSVPAVEAANEPHQRAPDLYASSCRQHKPRLRRSTTVVAAPRTVIAKAGSGEGDIGCALCANSGQPWLTTSDWPLRAFDRKAANCNTASADRVRHPGLAVRAVLAVGAGLVIASHDSDTSAASAATYLARCLAKKAAISPKASRVSGISSLRPYCAWL
jgi:hypothetical protein